MTGVSDVPAGRLIETVAGRLKEMEGIRPPEWAPYVKTGVHKEKAPHDPEWWYRRTASILRKVYLHAPVGVSHLGGLYGGYSDRGSKPNRARKGSRSVIRRALTQLEKEELVSIEDKRGRVVTPKGQKLLDRCAHEILLELVRDDPQMGKY